MRGNLEKGSVEWVPIKKQQCLAVEFTIPQKDQALQKIVLTIFNTGSSFQVSAFALSLQSDELVSFVLSTHQPNQRLIANLGVYESWMEKEGITVNLVNHIAAKALEEGAPNQNFVEVCVNSNRSDQIKIKCLSSSAELSFLPKT